jgi:quinol monooxygenase YgiN
MAPVTYLIVFDVVPEACAEFLELLEGVLDAMRDEPTFREAVLHRDPQRENRFMLCETWAGHEEVVEVQLKRPYRDRWHAALPRLLQHDRAITTWQPMRSDRALPRTIAGR